MKWARILACGLTITLTLMVMATRALGGGEPRDERSLTSDGTQEGSVTLAGVGEVDVSPLVHEGEISAPIGAVWDVFSTAEGFKVLGVAQCEMDFRVGGLIRTHYNPKGVLGDDGTIVNRIIAYEPGRMVAFRIEKPPTGFPFGEAWRSTWSVATLSDLGGGRTHLRLAGMGYTSEAKSQEMRAFFKTGNQWTIRTLQSHFDGSVKAAPMAKAHADDPLGSVEKEVVIEAPAGEVWARFTTPEGWKEFFGVTARIEREPGGRFEIEFMASAPAGERGSEGCNVLSVLPGRMISFSWNAPPTQAFARTKRTWVVVEMEALSAKRTRVKLAHMGFAELAARHPEHAKEFEQVRGYFDQAWEKVLERLSASFVEKPG